MTIIIENELIWLMTVIEDAAWKMRQNICGQDVNNIFCKPLTEWIRRQYQHLADIQYWYIGLIIFEI